MTDLARVEDPDTEPFWAAAREQRLVFGRCGSCAEVVFFLRRSCPHCGAEEVHLEESAGRGRVYTVTVTRRHPAPQFNQEAPFSLAWVDFDEGFRMLTRVLGEPGAVKIGDSVDVVWVEHGGQVLPCVRGTDG